VALSAVAHAQDSGPIDTIEVRGQRLESDIPRLLAQTGTQVDIIGQQSIKDGSYLDISQALTFQAPGLYVASQHGPFDYVDASLLGSRTSDVLWLVDGVRINNRLYAGTTPLDSLPASMVDHIEVIQGGQALFYGTQAVAGAVNIITRQFSDTPQGALTLGGDTNDGAHIDGFYSDSYGRSKFVLFGSGDVSDGYRSFHEDEYQPSATLRNRGYKVFSGGAKYLFEVNDDLDLTATYQKNVGKLDYPYPQLVHTAFNSRNEDLLTAKIDYDKGPNLQVFVKGYYHWWHAHFTEFDNNDDGGLDIIDDHDPWGYEDRGVNAMAKVGLFQGLSAVLGYDYQNYNGSDAVLVISKQSEEVHAVFGQLLVDPLANAHLAFGFRYNMPNVGEDAFVWNASGQFDLSQALYVKASVGTNFRLPTAEELFADDPLDERGNPDLKPERSISVNGSVGGMVRLGADVSWRLTGFYRRVKDLIDYETFDDETQQDVFGNVDGKVKTKGVEAYLSVPVGADFSADADYTYSHVREEGSSQQFNRIPQSILKVGVDYHPVVLPFGANVTVQHIGHLQDTVSGGIGDLSYGNYTIVNLGARYFVDKAHQHRLGLTLNNAFNEHYATRLTRGTADDTGDAYLVHVRGLPRTLLFNYTYSFK
jgi:vitamin B12 transporter